MATGHVARQVFDLPEPTPLIVTEHRARDYRCLICGTQTRAAFPDAGQTLYNSMLSTYRAHCYQ